MKKWHQYLWFKKRKMRLYLSSDDLKTNLNKLKGSVIAVITGILFAALLVAFFNKNIFTYFKYIFYYAFTSYITPNWDSTLVWWSLYIIAGLAFIVTFKAGMFNIGIAGQMLASGGVIIAFGIKQHFSQPVQLIMTLIISILAATLVAFFIVALRVFFNVHEVVSSILINWIIWYVVKWSFKTDLNLYDGSALSSKVVNDSLSLQIAGYKFYLPVILAFTFIVFIWFLFKKTTFGYKVKTVGLNPFVAIYAGINHKKYSITAFMLSGVLVGVMAFIYYVGLNPSFNFAFDNIPSIGFDSIAVALVGQANAWGVAASAILWGILKSAGQAGSVALGLPQALNDIIFAVIIYSAACVVVLSKLNIFKFIITHIDICCNRAKFAIYFQYIINILNYPCQKRKIKKYYKLRVKAIKLKTKINVINEIKTEDLTLITTAKIEVLQICRSKFKQDWKKLRQFFDQEYEKMLVRGYQGIIGNINKQKTTLYSKKIDQYIKVSSHYNEQLHELKQQYKTDVAKLVQDESWLKRLLLLCFKKRAIIAKTEPLKQEYKANIAKTKVELQQHFAKILQNEDNALSKLMQNKKQQLQDYHACKKMAIQTYKIQKKLLIEKQLNILKTKKVEYELAKTKIKNSNFSDIKQACKILKTNYQTEVKTLKQFKDAELRTLKNQLLDAKQNNYVGYVQERK